ncbi:MAG: right-handed parallel beta-helix repeat-containing protein [Paludibacter sp.]|nr:right-handed parallel beta-helix repeat-containing protein [Paludibacter sp.]
MRTKSLLLWVAIALASTISATTLTVTNGNASGTGSFTEAYTNAVAGDVINFNFDGTEYSLPDVVVMKSITIDGLNAFNSQKLILKQATASKSFFTLASGITATFKNLVFDGTGILGNTALTAANGSTLNIENCEFKNINAQANNGGAARIQGVANISGSLFENNIASGGYGGGALCVYNAASVTIDKCSFTGNTVNINGTNKNGGGAIVARATVAGACNVTITNSTFANNVSALTGGAILSTVISSNAYTANIKAINCTFTGNKGDGAISALTTINGTANVFLVNSIVVNNVNAAATAYSDILETKGTDVATVVLVEPHNVIYSVASETVVTAGRNCVQVADPATANIFYELETFATDKKRPVLTDTMGQTVALISSGSIAINAGVATLSGYTIPTVDQLNGARPATPAIGAVEYLLGTSVPGIDDNSSIDLTVKGKELTVSGLKNDSEMSVYGLAGNLLHKSVISNNQTVSLENISASFVIVKVQNQSFKLFLK